MHLTCKDFHNMYFHFRTIVIAAKWDINIATCTHTHSHCATNSLPMHMQSKSCALSMIPTTNICPKFDGFVCQFHMSLQSMHEYMNLCRTNFAAHGLNSHSAEDCQHCTGGWHQLCKFSVRLQSEVFIIIQSTLESFSGVPHVEQLKGFAQRE